MSVDAVFGALADSTRRELLATIATRGAATSTELASELPVTRQAVAKHLGVLAGAGLVEATREGRETRYRPTPQPLTDAIGWMVDVGGKWDDRLAALARAAEKRRSA